MVRLGYDRPLDGEGRAGPSRPGSERSPGCGGIRLDPDSRTVHLPEGVAIDPGGIGKGLAADLVVAELIDDGARGVLVNVGGDLAVAGEPPGGTGWSVAVEDPHDPQAVLAVPRLAAGGVATTTPVHRRWRPDTGPGLHVIDPRTGRPVDGDVAAVTVVAGQGWMAEAFAKAVTVAGAEAGLDRVDTAGLDALVVTAGGSLRLSARWAALA
jgi:thiamine biosynthesis lipoprotein